MSWEPRNPPEPDPVIHPRKRRIVSGNIARARRRTAALESIATSLRELVTEIYHAYNTPVGEESPTFDSRPWGPHAYPLGPIGCKCPACQHARQEVNKHTQQCPAAVTYASEGVMRCDECGWFYMPAKVGSNRPVTDLPESPEMPDQRFYDRMRERHSPAADKVQKRDAYDQRMRDNYADPVPTPNGAPVLPHAFRKVEINERCGWCGGGRLHKVHVSEEYPVLLYSEPVGSWEPHRHEPVPGAITDTFCAKCSGGRLHRIHTTPADSSLPWPAGDWTVEKFGDDWDVVAKSQSGGTTILTTFGRHSLDNRRNIAILAATAPKLYRLLAAQLEASEQSNVVLTTDWLKEIRAVLAEARGEKPDA